MRTTRRMAIAVALLAAVLLGSCAEEAQRDEDGAIVQEGELDVFSFEIGDCFSSGTLAAQAGDDEPATIGGVTAVPCGEAHENEVFHMFDVADGDDFPGTTAIQEEVVACLEPFAGYVGVSFEESLLDIGALWPTAETWELGDREIVCYLNDLDGEELTGSMKGSER